MNDTAKDYLDAVKLILGIEDTDSDPLLTLLIEDTVNAVLAYCRIEVLPRQLEGLIPQMAARLYNTCTAGDVKAVTEGERRVEYASVSDALTDYRVRLKPFMSREAYLPSEIGAEV